MPKLEGDDMMRTLVSAFQDAHLGISLHGDIPEVQGETAQSHLFRIIDFLNPEIWDDPSTAAISRAVILTVLHCAARLYEGGEHAKKAMALIGNEDTRAILSLGIQDNLSRVIHQRCVESIRSNRSKATHAGNCPRQADLFSAIRKNKARQLNHQAMIVEHISSLCRSHGATLQNTFDGPGIDEQFMFRNYITLSETLNLCEKASLVTLLPDIFQWESQESRGDVNELNEGLLRPNSAGIRERNKDLCANALEAATPPQHAIAPQVLPAGNENAATSHNIPTSLDLVKDLDGSCSWGPEACDDAASKILVSPPPHNLVNTSSKLQSRIALSTYKDIQEAFNFMDSSVPSIEITDGDVQHWLEEATAKEASELLGICDNWRIQCQHSRPGWSTVTEKALEFEQWMGLLRNRATAYHNSASIAAVTSVLKRVDEFQPEVTYKEEENRLISKNFEKEDAGDRDKVLKDEWVTDTANGDWNLLGGDDDSECIFPFSPPARDDTWNSKPLAAPLTHCADMQDKQLHDRITSAKPGAQVREYNRKTSLTTIPEESELEEGGERWPH